MGCGNSVPSGFTPAGRDRDSSRLEYVVEQLRKRGFRHSFSDDRSFGLKAKHTFLITHDDIQKRIHYIRGFAPTGEEFELFLPEQPKRNGSVLTHLSGLGVMPSLIGEHQKVKPFLGDEKRPNTLDSVLGLVNDAGYYGSTALDHALAGIPSVVVNAHGFSRQAPISERLITANTTKTQLQAGLALGEIISPNPSVPRVTLASHSFTAQELTRFMSNPHSYTEDGYCDAESVSRFVMQNSYTNPSDALRNVPLKLGGVVHQGFRFLAWAYEQSGGRVNFRTTQPFCWPSPKGYQFNLDHFDGELSEGQKEAIFVQSGSAAWFLKSPYAFVGKKRVRDPEYMASRPILAVVGEKDAISSGELQVQLYHHIQAWLSSSMDSRPETREEDGLLVLPDQAHNLFVRYRHPEFTRGNDPGTLRLTPVEEQREQYLRTVHEFAT